jgi:hypothetical protein
MNQDLDSNSNEAPHEILLAEFEYLANAAQQANEDRAKVIQYYFISLGSLAGSVVSLREVPGYCCRIFAIGHFQLPEIQRGHDFRNGAGGFALWRAADILSQ